MWAVVKINFDFGRFETFYPTKKPCKLSVFKPKVLFYREKSIEFECIQKSLFGKNYGKNGKNYGKNKRLNRQSFINKLTANEEKAMNSISNKINWDEYPDIITKDQLYKICHISKQTARRLLITGAIPCVDTGKKTRCFQIKKDDVIQYIKLREKMPELYRNESKSKRTYKRTSVPEEISDIVKNAMEQYYAKCLMSYDDVLTVKQISEITGYRRISVNKWCLNGHLKAFKKNSIYFIPKVFLIEFFCSFYFRSIINRTQWHNIAIEEISDLLEQNDTL